jgi:hypothetical protein
MTPEQAGQFAELGVDRLVPVGADHPERTIESAVAALAAL